MGRQLHFYRVLALSTLLTGGGLQAQEAGFYDGIRFGRSVLALEDLDGDGVRDFAVGAPAAPGPLERSGVVLVMSGAQRTVLQEWRGEKTRDAFGFRLQDAGDVNADGTHDVLVGYECQSRCEVRSGKDGALLLDFDQGWEEVIPFGDPNHDGAADLLLVGGVHVEVRNGRNGEQLGLGILLYKSGRVYPVGDLDGDELVDFVLMCDVPELFLSAPIKKRPESPTCYYPSKNRMKLPELWPDVFRPRTSGPHTLKQNPLRSLSAASAGDFDGDGVRDFLLCLSWWDSGVALGLSLNREQPLFAIHGAPNIGATTCMAPDLNGDGHPDILLAKPASAFAISVRAHSGLDGKRLWASDWADRGATTGAEPGDCRKLCGPAGAVGWRIRVGLARTPGGSCWGATPTLHSHRQAPLDADRGAVRSVAQGRISGVTRNTLTPCAAPIRPARRAAPRTSPASVRAAIPGSHRWPYPLRRSSSPWSRAYRGRQ